MQRGDANSRCDGIVSIGLWRETAIAVLRHPFAEWHREACCGSSRVDNESVNRRAIDYDAFATSAQLRTTWLPTYSAPPVSSDAPSWIYGTHHGGSVLNPVGVLGRNVGPQQFPVRGRIQRARRHRSWSAR